MNPEQADWIRRRVTDLMRRQCLCNLVHKTCRRCTELEQAKTQFPTEFAVAAELYALTGGAR